MQLACVSILFHNRSKLHPLFQIWAMATSALSRVFHAQNTSVICWNHDGYLWGPAAFRRWTLLILLNLRDSGMYHWVSWELPLGSKIMQLKCGIHQIIQSVYRWPYHFKKINPGTGGPREHRRESLQAELILNATRPYRQQGTISCVLNCEWESWERANSVCDCHGSRHYTITNTHNNNAHIQATMRTVKGIKENKT